MSRVPPLSELTKDSATLKGCAAGGSERGALPKMANIRVQRLAATGAPATWHANTLSNLTQAQRCQQQADANTLKSLASHDSTRYELDQQNLHVHRRLVVKVGHTRRLAERLQERINSVENSLRATQQSLHDLDQAFEAKKGPLEMNSWRQNRRAERPQRELVTDSLDGALAEEKQTLLNAQKLIVRSQRRTQKTLLGLQQVLKSLQDDLKVKKETGRIDQQCIETGSSWTGCGLPEGDDPAAMVPALVDGARAETPVSEAPTGLSKGTSKSLASGYSNAFEENENQRQFETIQLTNQAKKWEAQADELRKENAELIRHTQVQTTTALKGVEQRLCERAEETLVMSQRIEKAIEITDAKIDKAKRCLARTAAEIRSHEQPIDVAGVRQRLRQTQPRKERVNDEVADALSTQFASLRKNMQTLEQRHQEEKDSLAKLEEARAKLVADHKDK